MILRSLIRVDLPGVSPRTPLYPITVRVPVIRDLDAEIRAAMPDTTTALAEAVGLTRSSARHRLRTMPGVWRDGDLWRTR